MGFTLFLMVLFATLWFLNVYSDVYPNSFDIEIRTPFINTYYENSGGRESQCKYVSWWVNAQLEFGLRTNISQYYAQKWNKKPEPGGLRINPTTFMLWDSYPMFIWKGKRHSVLAYKEIVYPENGAMPYPYRVTTRISYCYVEN